jgi:hypothetical protein
MLLNDFARLWRCQAVATHFNENLSGIRREKVNCIKQFFLSDSTVVDPIPKL